MQGLRSLGSASRLLRGGLLVSMNKFSTPVACCDNAKDNLMEGPHHRPILFETEVEPWVPNWTG